MAKTVEMTYCISVCDLARSDAETDPKKQYSNRIQLPPPGMNLSPRNCALLPPKSICADESQKNGDTVTSDREWNADLVECQAMIEGWASLKAEQLRDQDPLHGNGNRSANISEECPFQCCICSQRLLRTLSNIDDGDFVAKLDSSRSHSPR